MNKETASFWPDIKKYEDILANDPKSYCFTILAELYRKVGLLDDAIDVANRGIKTHPEYIGGYMAVGRAYFEKGMKEESRESLERVVRVTPDNLLAQKLLSQIYVEQGDIPAAIKTLRVVELLNPEDVECRLMLESLEIASPVSPVTEGTSTVEDVCGAVPEETGATESGFAFSDYVVETELFEESSESVQLHVSTDITSRKDPLATATLAELYVSQGFLDRAIDVYRELLETGPDNEMFRDRLKELESNVSGLVETSETDLPVDKLPLAVEETGEDASTNVSNSAFSSNGEDRIISVLKCWLDNIKRGRNGADGDTQKYS